MTYLYRRDPNDKRGKWTDVFRSLLIILLLYMGMRWIFIEPFVIPSSSMETTLLVQDYVVVKKWAYGLRIPFTEKWLFGPQVPGRGDIVVFKALDDSGHFLVKRVVGLPGDHISIADTGFITVNGEAFSYREQPSSEHEHLRVFQEHNGRGSYQVQFSRGVSQATHEIDVPPGHIFMMGDNRNFSSDSRYWGPLPLERVMGQLVMIWMSCKDSDSYSSFLCAPQDFRKERIFKWVRLNEGRP